MIERCTFELIFFSFYNAWGEDIRYWDDYVLQILNSTMFTSFRSLCRASTNPHTVIDPLISQTCLGQCLFLWKYYHSFLGSLGKRLAVLNSTGWKFLQLSSIVCSFD